MKDTRRSRALLTRKLAFLCFGLKLQPASQNDGSSWRLCRYAAASIVYQVVDDKTSQVVKQFPEEAILRRRAYFNSLDQSKGVPTRMLATDRKI